MLNHSSAAVALCAAVVVCPTAIADVVFVNHAATGASNGQSWANAFTSLQAALAAATPGDQIWVAKGMYKPAPPGGARDAAFALKSGVEVYGGFVGNETSLSQRDPVTNITILSGDLNGNDLPGFANTSENSLHVLTALSVDAGAMLDGFTVSGGNANFAGEELLGGGGLFIADGSPRIHACIFTANSSGENKPNIGGFGGAIYVKVLAAGADVLIAGCSFDGNRGDSGGALGVLNQSVTVPHTVAIEDCLFLDNAAPHQTGGAVFSASSPFNTTTHQEIRFTRCRFEGNQAQYAGAIIEQNTLHFALIDCEFVANSIQVGGAALWHLHTASKDVFPARIHGCLFMANPGGAVALASTSAEVVGCTFLGNGTVGLNSSALLLGPYVFGCGRSLKVEGCLFSGNRGSAGPAIRTTCAEGVSIVNSTIAGNTGSFTSGAGVFSIAPVVIDNSVLWGNSAAGAMTQEGQIATTGAPIAANHNLIMGLTGSLGGVGNVGGDPLFLDPLGSDGIAGTPDDNLRLGAGSAAIDAADNLAVPTSLPTDLDGNPRFVDDPATPDTGVPGGAGGTAVVDMGAYEFQVDSCYPDCNGSGSLTVADFTCFQTRFVAGDPYADCNNSGTLTVADFTCFQTAFVAGCP